MAGPVRPRPPLVGQTALIHSAACGVVRTNRRSSARGSALFSSAGKAVTIEKFCRLPILGVEQSDREYDHGWRDLLFLSHVHLGTVVRRRASRGSRVRRSSGVYRELSARR